MDCLASVNLVNNNDKDRLAYSAMIQEVKSFMLTSESCTTHSSRCQNNVSHYLATYALLETHISVWLHSGQRYVEDLCRADCNHG